MEENIKFDGKITFKTIINFIDNKNYGFRNVFNKIKKVNSNNEIKSDLDHFVSVLFGKLAEVFVGQNFKKVLSSSYILDYSPMKNGYEIADIVIKNTINNNYKTIEVRSSFQKKHS